MDPEKSTALDDAALSALYASTRDTLHTPVVDEVIEARILAAARSAPRRRLHGAPWASAAVVVLTLGVAWQILRVEQPERAAQAPFEQPLAREAIADHSQALPPPAAASTTASPPATAPAAAQIAGKAMSTARLADVPEISEAPARADSLGIVAADAPATARVEEAPVAADASLEVVRSLLREGKREEARAALAALRSQEADRVLDAELDELLAAPTAPAEPN